MTKEDYYKSPYISQSDLKQLIGKPYDNPSLLGSLTDVMITDPEDLPNFLISKSSVTPAIKSILDNIFVNHAELNLKTVQSCAGDYGKGKYELDRIYKDVMKHEDYFEELLTGKQVVTQLEWDNAVKMTNIVNNHPRTQFLKDTQKQVAILNPSFYGYKVKGLLDFQAEDGGVIDLKTLYSMSAYKENFKKFRYDFQLTWYKDISDSKPPPKIVFVAPDADYPIVVQLRPETMLMARNGGYRITETLEIVGKTYKTREYVYGYMDLLRQYDKLKNLNFTYPYGDYETITTGLKLL